MRSGHLKAALNQENVDYAMLYHGDAKPNMNPVTKKDTSMKPYMKSPSTVRRTFDGNPEPGRRDPRLAPPRRRHGRQEQCDHEGHERADVQAVPSPQQLSTSTAAALVSRLGTGREREAQQRP